MTKLDHLSIASTPLPESEDAEPSSAYAHSILATLVKTLGTKIALNHLDVPKYIHSLVPRLFRLFIHSAVLPESGLTIASDDRLVNLAAQIVTMVVRTLSRE
jgi:DNA repair/transcription protein MET18/MMS19